MSFDMNHGDCPMCEDLKEEVARLRMGLRRILDTTEDNFAAAIAQDALVPTELHGSRSTSVSPPESK